MKALLVCFILATVFAPAVNAALVLATQCIDCALTCLLFPDATWGQFVQNTYRAAVNTAILGSILAFTQGHIPEELYTALFQTLAVISVIVRRTLCALAP